MIEQQIYADLRDKVISRLDAIYLLIEARFSSDEATNMVNEWIDNWEYQADADEEREQGWSA